MGMSPNEATTEGAKEDEGDSEFQPTRSDENPPAATQIDNEGTSTTEKTQTLFSTRTKTKTNDVRFLTAIFYFNRRHRMMYIPVQFA